MLNVHCRCVRKRLTNRIRDAFGSRPQIKVNVAVHCDIYVVDHVSITKR
jgi:hypothetical protein